ncbi:MAG TPA: EAL domain-containing protein [Candidatus Limnocylindria bacterium]|nr:EAL domain-containing protein [Candidatus Limnocylindria bacterium]
MKPIGRPRAAIPLLLAAIVLAGLTAYAMASLRDHADGRREAQVVLGALRADIESHGTAVWQALSAGEAAGQASGIETTSNRVAEHFNQLATVDAGDAFLAPLARAFADYETAAADVLSAGELGPSRATRAMREAAGRLGTLIEQADAAYRRTAEATGAAADLGTSTLLVSAAVLLVLLFRRSERVQRTALLLAHEKKVLRYSEERFRALVQNSSDMVTVIDGSGIIRYQSPTAQTLLGHRSVDLIGRSWQSMLHADDIALATDVLHASSQGRPWRGAVEWRMQRSDGSWLRMETAVTNLLGEPSVQGIVLNSRDVGERHELQRRLTHQAFHDPLTGLPNRAQFLDALQAALRRAHRQAASVCVLLLDLDKFKHVNDSLGHMAGDELLVKVGQRLRRAVRDQDMAARLAGDEFVVLLEGTARPEDGARVAERIVASLREPFTIMGKTVFTSASIGIVCRSASSAAEELLRDADAAMYRAKAVGEHGYVLFEPQMHAAAVERLQHETDLRQALPRGELSLAYQPVMHLASGRTIGVEALLRWRHPERGDVPPTRFIPVAEDTGLIHPIGSWVLETAARQLSQWRRLPGHGDLEVSVNLSARQLHDEGLAERLRQILSTCDLPASALVLEMTEGAFSLPDGGGAGVLRTLRELGVRVAIDDFGTGYSTLGRLRDLPIDMIKIDRSFIAGLDQPANLAIVRSMVSLAHAMDLESVAEGVETDEQLRRLRELDCTAAQGFLLGRPAPAEALTALLQPDGAEAGDGARVASPQLLPGSAAAS